VHLCITAALHNNRNDHGMKNLGGKKCDCDNKNSKYIPQAAGNT